MARWNEIYEGVNVAWMLWKCPKCNLLINGAISKESHKEDCDMGNAEKLWDLIFPVLTDKYKRVEGQIDCWEVTAYKVITTVRIDLKPIKGKVADTNG